MTQPQFLTDLFNDHYKMVNIMRNARQDVENIKRELMIYNGHEIMANDNLLLVSYMVGNDEEYPFKEFDLQKFEDWVRDEYAELNDGEYVVWIYPSPATPMREPMPYSMSLLDYTQENETDLVKEYFDKNK